MMDIQKESDLLRNVPMFAKLDSSKLKLLAFTSQCLSFDDGEVLFHQGDRADSAYVIMSGEVEILADTGGTRFIAGTLGKNDLFGELAVLTKSPRSATLRAKGELVALRISDDIFLKLLAENPEVALDVMCQLSEKLIRSHHQFEELKGELQKLETKTPEAPAG
ncbi:MAG TPA: cyclic nucleotide-binding domain-containing protein [Gammaproteobacteria bacterium]|nr:cyclic nucleotide-binding domain-containing protein [Gammaproteobacteria bacterium]